ncbi:MAG: hypothetical protein IPH24_09715 [Crocinitomicaceae bacterium]|nr:hypothetical protein [Crocinitomicaceae bacterium]
MRSDKFGMLVTNIEVYEQFDRASKRDKKIQAIAWWDREAPLNIDAIKTKR